MSGWIIGWLRQCAFELQKSLNIYLLSLFSHLVASQFDQRLGDCAVVLNQNYWLHLSGVLQMECALESL